MIIIAASLYLPEHITTILSRAWFYYAGDEQAAAAHTALGTGAGLRAGGGGMGGEVGKGDGARMEGQQVMDMLGTL